MLKGFKNFLLRGNVVDLAVAVVIGAAFTAVVNQFADSFLTPLVNLLGGGGKLGGSFTVGDQKFAWGAFVSQVITFAITAAGQPPMDPAAGRHAPPSVADGG